jgi:hypothetical protein
MGAKVGQSCRYTVRKITRNCGRCWLFSSSPGWTRTSNPPVNSRMLCQLSYRGTARLSVTALDGLARCCSHLLKLFLERFQPLRVGLRELPAKLPFPESEEQLLGRLLVDSLRRGARVQLG